MILRLVRRVELVATVAQLAAWYAVFVFANAGTVLAARRDRVGVDALTETNALHYVMRAMWGDQPLANPKE